MELMQNQNEYWITLFSEAIVGGIGDTILIQEPETLQNCNRNGINIHLYVKGGYLNIEIGKMRNEIMFGGSFIISVIDVDGNQRFTRSFVLDDTSKDISQQGFNKYRHPACIEKFIALETLLRNSDECLRCYSSMLLMIDIEVFVNKVDRRLIDTDDIIYFLGSTFNSLVGKIYGSGIRQQSLVLNSELGKRLAEESIYFKTILDSQMVEGRRKLTNLPPEECATFQNIKNILLDVNPLTYQSDRDILEMYRIANKYDIPVVTHTCKCFLKLFFSEHPEYLEKVENSENQATVDAENVIEGLKANAAVVKADFEKEARKENFIQKHSLDNSEEILSDDNGDIVQSHLFIDNEIIESFIQSFLSPVWNEIRTELFKEIRKYLEIEVTETDSLRKIQIGDNKWIYKRYTDTGRLWFEKAN